MFGSGCRIEAEGVSWSETTRVRQLRFSDGARIAKDMEPTQRAGAAGEAEETEEKGRQRGKETTRGIEIREKQPRTKRQGARQGRAGQQQQSTLAVMTANGVRRASTHTALASPARPPARRRGENAGGQGRRAPLGNTRTGAWPVAYGNLRGTADVPHCMSTVASACLRR